MTSSFDATRGIARSCFIAGAMALVLTACGGGGSSTPEPTALPASLTVSIPATRQSVDGNVEFSSNGSAALSYQWTFGDGTTSTSANPAHNYSKPGTYTGHVTVTNEAGAKADSDFTVTVSDMSLTQGKACTGESGAGWCWQNPLPQGNAISSTFHLDSTHAWAVGELGTILFSANGGKTWTVQRSGTDFQLYAARFVDANVGWVVGANGAVLRTLDGGAHWTVLSAGTSLTGAAVGALDANTAWVSSNYSNSIMLTKDGGVSWSTVSDINASRYAVVSATDIWAAPYMGWTTTPILDHSTNGGASWTPVAIPSDVATGLSRQVIDFRFSDATHGWLLSLDSGWDTSTGAYVNRAVGSRTADGGVTWQAFDADPFQLNSTPYYSSGYVNFEFIDATTAFARSNYGFGYKRTTDGGATWQDIPLPSTVPPYFSDAHAYSAQIIQLRDYWGSVYVSFDGGANWDKQSQTSATTLNSVWFFGTKAGTAISNDGATMRTADGGQTWTTTVPTSYSPWSRMQFLADASVGWVISGTGTIYRSTDKGLSWLSPVPQTSATIYGLTDFHFVDASHGWAVSACCSSSVFYKTIDGGASWEAAGTYTSINSFQSLRFIDLTHGIAVGPSGFVVTTADGGATWQPHSSATASALRRVALVDANTAVAVGDYGAIVRSTDRGQSWTHINSPTGNSLSDVRFVNAKVGMAVGSSGTVLATADGGLTWTVQPTSSHANLLSIFLTDDQTGWAVGDNGTILVTATGGR